MTTWQKRYQDALLQVFGTPQAMLVSGEGARVTDVEGRTYLDLLAGIAVNALGHAHPAVVDAVSHQIATLGQVSNFFTTPQQIRLAEKLIEISAAPTGSAVFFCNSGTEANEAALKLARRAGAVAGEHAGTGPRTKILAVEGAFHGRTMGALAMTAKADYRLPFGPGVPDIEHLPFGDIAALHNAVDDTVAALIIEPIQGEAGVREHPAGYLRAAREATSRAGALLILDEVQTGVGRTGSWFAYLNDALGEGITPDAMTLAKGLGGGMPIGALLTFGSATSSLLSAGQHGTTFGGNPVCAAAALAVLDAIEDGELLDHVTHTGAWLRSQLADIPGVQSVSGQGLLTAFGVTPGLAPQVAAEALKTGYIINPVNPDHIRLAPPFIITDVELAQFLNDLPGILARAEHHQHQSTEPVQESA